jgi:hypothetical protein
MYKIPTRQKIVQSKIIKGRVYICSKYMNKDFDKPLNTENNE